MHVRISSLVIKQYEQYDETVSITRFVRPLQGFIRRDSGFGNLRARDPTIPFLAIDPSFTSKPRHPGSAVPQGCATQMEHNLVLATVPYFAGLVELDCILHFSSWVHTAGEEIERLGMGSPSEPDLL